MRTDCGNCIYAEKHPEFVVMGRQMIVCKIYDELNSQYGDFAILVKEGRCPGYKERMG